MKSASLSSKASSQRGIAVRDLGVMNYGEALALQRELRDARLASDVPDTLLLVEHPPVYTLGRRSEPSELLVDHEALKASGAQVYEIERGGKITFHGPGQLVGYPILDLRALALSVPRYVHLLEQTLINYLETLSLTAERRRGFPGVWVKGRKIGAVGVHVKQWVTMHGFALNLSTDLKAFEAIVACGISDAVVTSVTSELGDAPSMAHAKRDIARLFSGLIADEGTSKRPLVER
ncbi:MAG: lipoyl(octanoyl) transferase LipB [Chloroflexi bacterium]|nr:lipoyl(octanoyl) transferase LipB [Chloroflexota bacterium]